MRTASYRLDPASGYAQTDYYLNGDYLNTWTYYAASGLIHIHPAIEELNESVEDYRQLTVISEKFIILVANAKIPVPDYAPSPFRAQITKWPDKVDLVITLRDIYNNNTVISDDEWVISSGIITRGARPDIYISWASYLEWVIHVKRFRNTIDTHIAKGYEPRVA